MCVCVGGWVGGVGVGCVCVCVGGWVGGVGVGCVCVCVGGWVGRKRYETDHERQSCSSG